MRESAENLFAVDPVLGEADRLWWLSLGLSWCELAEGTVRPGCVVVLKVLVAGTQPGRAGCRGYGGGPAGRTAGATVNHNSAAQEYVFGGAYADCTLWAGDQHRTDGRAQGEADIWCPSYHTYRMRVYLEFSYYQNGAGQGLLADNVAGTPITSYGEDATTAGVCGYSGYWTTYLSYSIDGSPYSGWYQSTPNSHYVAAAC